MAKPIGVWGIDIGQCALKAIRLEMIDGKPTATAFDYIEHAKILSQPDADPDALTREALEKFLSRNPLGNDQVAIAIAGQSGLVRFVKLPPVEEKKIGDIVKFEAKQQIPFPLDEVVWDFQKIAGGEAVGGFAMETEIGLFAMKRDIINKHLGHYNAVGAEVHFVQMAPLALCNFATYELLKRGGPDGVTGDAPPAEGEDETPRGKKRCTVVLDIGTDSSNLIITDAGKIIWQRPIPLGGNHFTRALTKEMKLTFAKAEHLKRNAAKSPDLAQILRALRPILTEFVGEVQRSLGYFTNTHRDAHVAHLVGLGSAFKLPGLQKYLSEKLSLEVKKPTGFTRISGDQVLNDPTFTDNILTFPVAYGLALQGLGMARIQTSLLPNEVRVERMVRAKKPAVAAAAAAILLGTGFLAIGYGAQLSAVSDDTIAKAMEKADSAVKSANSQKSLHTSKQTEVKTTQDEVKAIVVGNDERLNWIRVQEVITAALPRHGYFEKMPDGSIKETAGSNLMEEYQIPFWNTQQGQRAYEKLRERMAAGIPLEKLFDADMSQYLASVNIEAIHCRYTDNIGTFLTAADNYASRTLNMNIADDLLPSEIEDDEANKRKKPKAVEGGGWIFELRGYTFYETERLKGPQFLRNCLIQNLKKFDTFASQGQADQKVAAIIPGATDPVKGKMSHVFLLRASPFDATLTQPQSSPFIANSLIETLIRGGGGAGSSPPSSLGTGGMSDDPGAGGAGRLPGAPGGASGGAGGGGWTPLTLSGTGGGGGFNPGMPSTPDSGAAAGGPGASAPGLPTGPGASAPGLPPGIPGMPAAGGPQPAATGAKKSKIRYDFVVCFVWREPTPTDPTPTAGQ